MPRVVDALVVGETGEDLDMPLWPFMAFIGICGAVFVARLVANPTAAKPAGPASRDTWI